MKILKEKTYNCRFCNEEFTSLFYSVYCTVDCRDKQYNKVRRQERPTCECTHCKKPLTGSIRKLFCNVNCKMAHRRLAEKELAGPIEPGICYFCGVNIHETSRKKFCCDIHKQLFYAAKKANRPIRLRLDAKTQIETRRYNDIPKLVNEYLIRKANEMESFKNNLKVVATERID